VIAETTELLRRARLLPVVAMPDVACAVPLARTLADAGLPIIEVVFRTPAAAAAIEAIRGAVPGVRVGAGTILTPDLAGVAIAAGAQFLVAPHYDEATLEVASRADVPMIPGVMTPTEVARAQSRGHLLLKLFPAAALGGATYLRTLADVYPDVRFVPTGGVTLDTLRGMLDCPNVVACGGSWLAPAALLRERRWDAIGKAVTDALTVAGGGSGRAA
jgi:2-dehydro-3-deoxyphosphogluconate aldolase/(4S)-4-hydroxy-2-oxoglutarate aldolase